MKIIVRRAKTTRTPIRAYPNTHEGLSSVAIKTSMTVYDATRHLETPEGIETLLSVYTLEDWINLEDVSKYMAP